MIFLFLALLISTNTFAHSPEQLIEQNAFPDEIISRLQKGEQIVALPAKEQKFVRIGKIESMLIRQDNPHLYDFTTSYEDGTTLTITQDNSLGLKTNDIVKTTIKNGISHIIEKVY